MSEENLKEKDNIIDIKQLEKDSKEVKEDDNKVENLEENNDDNNKKDNKEKSEDKKTSKDKDDIDNENIFELKKSSSDKTDDIFSRKESKRDKVSDKEEEEDNNEEEIEEENDEEDIDDEEDDDDDDDEDDDDDDDEYDDKSYDSSRDKKKKDPYHAYINSKVDNFCYYINFEKGDYLYGKEQKKFYKVINYIDTKKGNDKYEITLELIDNLKSKTKKGKLEMKKISENILYNSLSYEINKKEEKEKEKDKKDEEKKNIENNNNNEQKEIYNNIDISKKQENEKDENKKEKTDDNKNKEKEEKKEDDNNNNPHKENKEEENDNNNIKKEDKNKNDKDNKEKNKDNQNNNKKSESLKKNNSKKIIKEKPVTVTISLKDHSKYTYHQKIKIFYINYLNIYHKIEMLINMNASINELILKFIKLYHIPRDHYGEKNPLQIIINNKKYTTGNKVRKKYFIPINFDYKNDYIIILEKQNNYLYEVSLGSKNTYINLKGAKIPHFVYSRYYNYQLESFIISRNIAQLECEIYELKKEAIFEINNNNEKNTKKKIKDFLDLNWKERSNLITTIKSGNIKKSKENYDAICFEINRKFILTHGKSYVFLVTSQNKKIYAFQNKNISKEGLIIISKDDKSILNGFKVKKVSDLGAY